MSILLAVGCGQKDKTYPTQKSATIQKPVQLPNSEKPKRPDYAIKAPDFTLKTVEYYWKAEKQSKNTKEVIKLAEEIGSQSVRIYEGAEKALENIKKTNDGVDIVMRLIKDGRGSLLGKVLKIKKVGGLSLKRKLPEQIDEENEFEDDEINKKSDQDQNRIN